MTQVQRCSISRYCVLRTTPYTGGFAALARARRTLSHGLRSTGRVLRLHALEVHAPARGMGRLRRAQKSDQEAKGATGRAQISRIAWRIARNRCSKAPTTGHRRLS